MTIREDEMVARLQRYDRTRPSVVPSARGTRTVYPLINPDGHEAADTITALSSEREILREALAVFARCPKVGKNGGRFVIAKALYEDEDGSPREAHWHMSDFDNARAALDTGVTGG